VGVDAPVLPGVFLDRSTEQKRIRCRKAKERGAQKRQVGTLYPDDTKKARIPRV